MNMADRRAYNVLRNAHTATLRKNKADSWKSFCSAGGKEPWGKLYHWLRDGNKRQTYLGLMMRPDGTKCTSLDESVDILLNTLIPNDPAQQGQADEAVAIWDVPLTTSEELRELTWTISPNRAPGKDCITGRIMRALWPSLSTRYHALANNCLRRARFPDIWKSAMVVPIIKGDDRDASIPKSFRPVSLLPVMGKIVEKLINKRLNDQIQAKLTGKQYGFTRGKSTLDAVDNLLVWNALREETYAITSFLDISGAFDNLAWPALQVDLESIGASIHMRR